jgi:ketosteroid isomerase-like protein
MGQADKLEVVRRMFERYSAGAPGRALELLHPEVEFDTTVRPDGKVWRGREGVRDALAEWTETWQDFELHIDSYVDAGEDRVAVLWREQGRTRDSGVELSQEGVTVCTVRDGLIVAMAVKVDRAGTLAALGVDAAG